MTKQYFSHSELRTLAEDRERENPPPPILDCGHTPGRHEYFVVSFWTDDDGKTFCHACREARENARILDCGHTPTVPHSAITSGTAHTADGREICVTCAEAAERADFRAADRYVGYFNRERRVITTWTGAVLARVTWTSTGRHNMARTMLHWNAVDDATGARWYGKYSPDWGDATKMHRAKG